jgi:prevent-host-death family protein
LKTLPLSEVKARLSGLVKTVSDTDEEIVITRNGSPAAVLVSLLVSFTLTPMVASLGFSFVNLTISQEEPLRFVGLENYGMLARDSQVWSSLWVTVKFALVATRQNGTQKMPPIVGCPVMSAAVEHVPGPVA